MMTIRKINKILIILLVFALNCKSSFSYTLTDTELLNIINLKLKKETQEQLKNYPFVKPSDFKISITGISNNPIITNETTIPKIEIQNQNKTFQKNSAKRVLIKNQNGTLIKAIPINVQTLVYADVLIAKDTIGFNQEITKNNTQIEKKEISNYINKVITKIDTNKVSKRNYQKGSIILSDSIKEKSAITKDSIIDIVFLSNNGLKIKVQGKALKEGAIGETILVRSIKYNKIYNAKINSSNEVTVKI